MKRNSTGNSSNNHGEEMDEEKAAFINDDQNNEGVELNLENEDDTTLGRSVTKHPSHGKNKKRCMASSLVLILLLGGIAAALAFTVFAPKPDQSVDSSEESSSEGGVEWTGETEVSPYTDEEETATEEEESVSSSPPPEGEAVPEEMALYILQKSLPTGSYELLSQPGSPQSDSLDYILNQDVYVYDWTGMQQENQVSIRNFVQRYVLSTLYFGMKGQDWDDNTNWNSKLDVCTWYGVGCDGNEAGEWDSSSDGSGIITSLKLSDNGLEGKLMGDLSALTELNTIEFHSNYIEGSIPPAMYSMKSLSVLFLDDNYIEGTISSNIGKMNLSRLTLSDNDLEGTLPEEMPNELVMLWLFNNEKLGGAIPESWGALGNLGEFELLVVNDTTLSN